MTRFLSWNYPSIFKRIPYFNNTILRTYVRHIEGGNIIILNEKTLTGRLINYLKPQKTDVEKKKTDEIMNARGALALLKKGQLTPEKLPDKNLVKLIGCLEDVRLVNSTGEFFKVLKLLDEVCSFRAHSMKPSEIFDILDAYLDLIPTEVTKLLFYRYSIDHLFTIKEEWKDQKMLMKFIFYVGLMKKQMKSQKILKQTISTLTDEDILNLTCEELCIIANSTFKTSTKIANNHILKKIRNYLYDNLMLMKDPAIFITLIKSLRHNRFCDEELLVTISCALFFNKSFKSYSFQTYCHLLALYSDNLYYDENLLKLFTEKCLAELKSYDPLKKGTEKIRLKDIERFLWIMSNLNCTILTKDQIKHDIKPSIIALTESSDIDMESLIDIMIHLWILGYKCYELIPYFMEKKEDCKGLLKHSLQLNLLLTCIYHEDRNLFKELSLKPTNASNFPLSSHIKKRPCLKRVMDALNKIGKQMDMNFRVSYQIPYINIAGIVGYRKDIYQEVNIEVLDNYTILKNTEDKPTGFMQVKLRILDGQEEGLILVRENGVEGMTEAELEDFLEDELYLVCSLPQEIEKGRKK